MANFAITVHSMPTERKINLNKKTGQTGRLFSSLMECFSPELSFYVSLQFLYTNNKQDNGNSM